MIKVLVEGEENNRKNKKENREYIKKCRNCKCVFTYQKKDVLIRYDNMKVVYCPCCKHYCNIIFPRRYRGVKGEAGKICY